MSDLSPEEVQEMKSLKARVEVLEHRNSLNSGADLLQKAAKTGGAIMFFFGVARGVWKAVTVWMDAPK